MNKKKLLTWLPQVLSISLTLLLFTFLFQFTPEGSKWPHFMYALIPGLTALLFAVLAWFFPKPGGIVYVIAGLAYTVLMWGKVTFVAIGILSGVSIVTGILYFLQEQEEKKGKPAPQQVPTAKKKIKEKTNKLPGTMTSLTKKARVPVKEPTKTQQKELPPLPPKTNKPKAITEVVVDNKESSFFGNIPTATKKENEKVESKLLEPQTPKAEIKVPTLDQTEIKSPPLPTQTEEAPVTPVLKPSALGYHKETAESLTATTDPKTEPDEVTILQLPTESDKKTIIDWKSADLDANATTQVESNNTDIVPDLPQVSLTSKDTAQSGEQLARVKSTTHPTPESGVNPDFMQWTKKEE